MTYTHANGGLADEAGALTGAQLDEVMGAVLARMERIEGALARIERLADQLPAAAATAADVFDGLYRDAAQAGIDGDERLKLGLAALERLTAPASLRAITGLSEHLSALDQLARQAPGFLAMTVDMVDELYAAVGRQGINLEETAKQGLVAFRNFVALLQTDEVRALLDSGVLDPKTLQVIGAAAHALVCTQREPRRAGPLALLRALFNRNIQRALGFALGFAERFGQSLPTFPDAKK